MNRKTRRAMSKEMGQDSTETLAQKFSQFGKLPSQCSACKEPFDKQDREMLASWNVVVRQETVRIFCPHCIEKTKEILNEHK
tara:strand:+ start:287 stop:532 length:246 start_codon:yes stop_codon:yes gene_type:complete